MAVRWKRSLGGGCHGDDAENHSVTDNDENKFCTR